MLGQVAMHCLVCTVLTGIDVCGTAINIAVGWWLVVGGYIAEVGGWLYSGGWVLIIHGGMAFVMRN